MPTGKQVMFRGEVEQAKAVFEKQIQEAYASGIEAGAKMALAGFAEKYGIDPVALMHRYSELVQEQTRLWEWACAQQDLIAEPQDEER